MFNICAYVNILIYMYRSFLIFLCCFHLKYLHRFANIISVVKHPFLAGITQHCNSRTLGFILDHPFCEDWDHSHLMFYPQPRSAM